MRWTGEREGRRRRRAETGKKGTRPDKVRDERDAGRKRQRGGTRGKWRCGAVVGAGRGRLCSLSCGRAGGSSGLPSTSTQGQRRRWVVGAFVCVRWCGGCFACCCGFWLSACHPCCSGVPRGDGLSRESPWTFGPEDESNLRACDLRHCLVVGWSCQLRCLDYRAKMFGVELGTKIT